MIKKYCMLLGAFFIVFSHADNFKMGTIEVSDIKASMDKMSFQKNNSINIVEPSKKEKNISIETEEIKKSNRFVSEVNEKYSYFKTVIGDDSHNLLDVNYNEKSLNYLWNGSYTVYSEDVPEIGGKIDYWRIGVDYDDIWDGISFSTESFFSSREEDFTGVDSAVNNSYSVRDDIMDLNGNVYISNIKNWNFSGRIAEYEKAIDGSFVGSLNDKLENNIFEAKAYRQYDIDERSFADLMICYKKDNLKTRTADVDNDRFDISIDLNVVRDDFSVITNLSLFNSDDEDETAFYVDYNKYGKNDKINRISFGKKYEVYDYERLFFIEDRIVGVPAAGKMTGETVTFIEYESELDYRGKNINYVIKSEDIDNKVFYSQRAINDIALIPGKINSVNRLMLSLKTEIYNDLRSTVDIGYTFDHYDTDVPFEAEHKWNISLEHDYTENTVFTVDAVFTGKYENGLGVENDSSFLVNLLMDHKITEKMYFNIDISNLFDSDYTVMPGLSEDERKITLGLVNNF